MATPALKDISAVLSRFLEHWSATDAFLAPKPLVLRPSYGLSQLTADHLAFLANQRQVTDLENTTQTAAGRRRLLRESLRERLRQFRAAVLADFADTEFAPATPKIPLITASDALWRTAMDDMASLWQRINTASIDGFTGPLTLVGGYTVAQFLTDTAALNTAAQAVTTGEQALKNLRRTRDSHIKPVIGKLVRYRKAVVNRLPEDHTLLKSLPGLD